MIDTFMPKMSYSSACTIRKCERKYWLQKVVKAPIDDDASTDSEAFLYGKAYHEVLELTRRRRPEDLKAVVLSVKEKYELDRDQTFRVYAMADKYYQCREATGLVELASEIRFHNDDFIGFIDAILADPVTELWYISDDKTSTRINATLLSRVHRDYQLNFYVNFVDDIVEALGLKKENFAGVRYGICVRPSAKPKKTERLYEFSARIKVPYDELVVPASALDPQTAMEFVKDARTKQARLFKARNIEETTPNFLSCEDYSKPCEYWSRCYGHTVTSQNKTPISLFSKQPTQESPEEETPDF